MADRVDRREVSKQARWWKFTSIVAVLAVVISGVVGPSFAAFADSDPDASTTTIEPSPPIVEVSAVSTPATTPPSAPVGPPAPAAAAEPIVSAAVPTSSGPATTSTVPEASVSPVVPPETTNTSNVPAVDLPQDVASRAAGGPMQRGAGDPQYLSVSKTVSDETPLRGESFTYTISVTCTEASCIDAELTDALPAGLAGYQVLNVTATPSTATVPRVVTWTQAGAPTGQPTVIGPATVLRIDFNQPTSAPVGTGLEFGTTFNVNLTLKVPDVLAPGTYVIPNTAETTAENSADDASTATITVVVPVGLAVAASKTWTPTPQTFNPGSPSTVTLGAANNSNTAVDTLVVQEPAIAAPSAATLDPSNPFTITDFTGFGTSTLPPAATAVSVDAYVFDTGTSTWGWVTGTSGPSPALPGGVAEAAVGGLRFTYTAPNAIAIGASATVRIELEQRATNRNSGADLSTASQTVNNVARVSVTSGALAPATADARATYRVNPAKLVVEASKNINPDRIAAGDSALATIGATNGSDVGVNEFRLSDLNYFTAGVTFGGFTGAPTWPSGATGATVVYYPLAGGPSVSVAFANGATPASPAGLISGFELVYTATSGGIAGSANTSATFTITTSETATGATVELLTTNTATAKIVAPNGLDATDTANDTLMLVKPGLDITLNKTILPSTPVEPGDSVITRLTTNLTTTSDYVTATQIVVEDAWDGTTGDFWDGFNLSEIAPTQVPANTKLTVAFQTAPGTWNTLTTVPSTGSPSLLSLTTAQIAALIDPTPISSVTGLRFTFDKPTGFASGTTVTPYVVTTARGQLRSGGTVTAAPDSAVTYTNVATADGVGKTVIGTDLVDSATATDDAQIITRDGTGVGVGIDKKWNSATVSAQTGEQRTTALTWNVAKGYNTVAISDPIDPTSATSPAQTVFQAFDLRAVQPIGASSVPFSNGWYLRYDTITSIELYRSGGWTTVAAPGGGWNTNGAFAGYNLSPTEVADTTGVRINLAENVAARDAAQQIGANYDPYAPRSGTGVTASTTGRSFVLNWQIRDKTRINPDWVTATETYNTGDAGVVNNNVGLVATPPVGPPATASGDDDITIVDVGPDVSVTKSVVANDPTFVPFPGRTPAADYPTATYTLTAKNGSVARASYVRVTDPPACTDAAPIGDCASSATPAGAIADPFVGVTDWLNPTGSSANPFERYDLTDLTIGVSIPTEVDLAASTVWLLRYDTVAGTYSTTSTTAAAANTLDAAALANVVGVSVTFQNTDPATTGGNITEANNLNVTMNTRLRTTLRSSGADQVLNAGQTRNVTNRVAAQSYDPILSTGVVAADRDATVITLTGGVINVAPTKSVSPTAITEPQRDQAVTVTVGANQGLDPRSTLSPSQVRVRDDSVSSPEFWDSFDLTSLGTITAPDGADRVTVAVYGPYGPGATMAWINDGPSTIGAAALPGGASDRSLIEGIEFTYTRADGGFFSATLPAPTWSTTAQFTAQLRDTYRSSGEPITFEVAATVDNTVNAQSSRPNEASDEKRTTASVNLIPGSRELSVSKLTNEGNRFATVGGVVPFDVTFKNTGTGFLTIEELRDTLPSALLYLGDPAPVTTPDPTGLLPAEVTVTQVGSEVVFTWPADDRTMAPGETYNIRIWLELQPVASGVQVINTMTVRTTETLGACGHIGPGDTTDAFDDDPKTCGTTDYVTPASGANLFTVKGVRGSRPGAFVPGSPASICSPSLATGNGSYYRTPCVANSVIGGTDDWVLRVLNAGTIPVTDMTVFDQFPVAGDRFFVSGAGRGSVYRPEFVASSLQVAAPAGATWTVQVTASANICVGTWGGLTTQAPCEQNGETWVTAGSIPWSEVSGLRIVFDFTGTPSGTLASAQGVDITYSSRNVAATLADPSGASTVVPAADEFAWNQFGVKYRNQNSATSSKIAPNRVGVHLLSGPILINKVITGEGAGYAPDAFDIDVTCSIDGTPLQLGDAATVTLDGDNGYTVRIDGIPVGSSCTVTEQGELGAFGETGREGSSTVLAVAIPAGVDEDVPAAQIATITNEYGMTELSVTKRIDTNATGAELGPFDFSLSCTTLLDVAVVFPGDLIEILFTLAGGETFTAPPASIPIGSTCTVSEVDSAHADLIAITGVGVIDLGDGIATIELGDEPGEVTIANTFGAGELVVAKIVDGDGAALYGSGPFGFTAVCTYFDQTVLDTRFDLGAGERRSFGPYPAGAQCLVAETATSGASSSTLDPTSGSVTIADDTAVSVTATNTFGVTAVEVTKTVTGARPSGDLVFTVGLSCTVARNNVPVPVTIPGGATRELASPDRLTARYADLPTGAACVVTETERRGASTTTVSIDGVLTIGASARFVTPAVGTVEALAIGVVNDYAADLDVNGGSSRPPGLGNGSGPLPSTGSEALDLLLAAIAVTLAGVGLLRVGRNRRGRERRGRIVMGG